MMERALKERIIGAAVLVVVVVLVVPVFLDGPPAGGEIVSEQVPLPGQSDQETKTVVLDRDRSNPVPSNGSSKPAEATPQQAVTREEPKPEPVETQPTPQPVVEETPEAEAETPAPESSTTGMWAVQLGSFGNQENAERLAAELRKQGHAAFLSQVSTSNGQLHRVRVGPQADRASADAVAETLRRAGHDVKVLPHP
jgi:DedD protein